MSKKFWLAAGAAFVAMAIMEYLVNALFMMGDYAATANLWRPMPEMKFWIFYVVYLFTAFFFTLIFTKGYEGKGIAEGVRYGFYVGMLIAVPMAYGSYASMPLPYMFALKWFIFGLLEYIILGIVVAAVYGKREAAAPAK
jgi:hypothetical protein